MKVKTVVVSLLVAAWLGGGAWALRYAAGGAFYIVHKTDPRKVHADTWQQYWDQYQDDPKEKKRLQVSMGLAALGIFGLPLILIALALSKSRSLHGEARWATVSEARAAKLLAEEGLILGKLNDKFLMMNEAKFVMLVAPTRSGKGVGTIIPNLLNWNQSVIVVDIKGENFDVTSGYRARHGQEVYKWAPFDEHFETHCSNPLSYVSRDPRFVVGELQSVGYMLYPKKDGDGAFWNDAARNLFVALSLYCLESGYALTMGEVLRRSSGSGRPKEFWQAVVDSQVSASGQALSKHCLDALSQFVSNSDNTLTSILSTFSAPLGAFTNPAVDAATSHDDFDLRDIRRRKMSIYVVIPPNRLAEASLLINLFFSIAIDQNTKTLPEKDPSLKYLALLLLDEFPALGRVDKYMKSIGYIAGYGLRSLMIAQSISQLKDRDLYGEEGTRTLATNHMIQIIYAPREQQDAQEYSEILGYYGLSSTSKGVSRGRGAVTNSENVSDQKRALMLPQELREIGPDRVIVMADNCKPIFADKIKYYSDPAFKERLMPPVKVAPLDMDTFIAKSEGRVRALEPGEPVSAGKLAVNLAAMPPVTNTGTPVAQEVSAMADWLFSNVQWAKQAADDNVLPCDNTASRMQQELEITP
jgi:type IV secretion system protein VirD4